MSLEVAINRNSDLLEKLIATLQSGAVLGVAAETAAAKPASRKKVDTPAAGAAAGQEPAAAATATYPATNDGRTLSVKLVAGDVEGTRYFHIAAHNTVAAIAPGESIPELAGIVEVDGDQYTGLKAGYAAQFPTSAAGAQTSSPAATPASTSPAASPASATPQSASAAAVTLDGPALTQKCKDLHGKLGNDGLKQVLTKFGADKVGTLITKTADYPAIVAFIESLLNPQAAAAPAGVDLF